MNGASIAGQCGSVVDAYEHTSRLVDCLRALAPGVVANRYRLSCPEDLDSCCLIPGEPFAATVQKFRAIDGDICRLWFTYTRNRFNCESDTEIVFEIVSTDVNRGGSHVGSAPDEKLVGGITWLSFGGTRVLESSELKVTRSDKVEYVVVNAHRLGKLTELIPCFHHSSKHPEDAYYDKERNEDVAGMPIRDLEKANDLLRCGIPSGSDFFSYDTLSQRYFRFKHTRANLYHGFEVARAEVPNDVLQILFPK